MRAHIVRFLALAIVLTIVIFAAAGSITPVPTGQWAGTTALSQVRAGAASVLLPDGRILITGGDDAGGNPSNAVELFNTDGSVTVAATMSVARAGHTAIVLYTGDVLVAGGRTSGGGFTNSAELYDALNNRWSAVAGTLVDARAGHTASMLPTDGSVILAGGENSGGPVASVERYDLYNNNFSYAGTLATSRSAAAAALLNDGRVLVAGGRASDGSGNLVATASTEIFDPASGSASAGPAMSSARADLSATTLLDGTVLLAGGNDGSNDLASTEIFDPVAGAINPGAAMSAPRSGHQAFLLPNNNSVLLVGGSAAGQALASAELYVPWTNSSAATGSMTAARTRATGAPMQQDGLLLVAGGDSLSSSDLYGFATVKTDNGDYAPGEVVTITGSGWKPGETVTLTLVESPNLDTHAPLTAVADANGNIFNNQFAPDEHDLNVRFYLTAVGSQSQAENSFTDATPAKVNFKATGLPSGVTLSVSYNGTNNGGNPTSGSASFTTPGTSADVGLLPSSSLSFTFPASVTTGGTTYNFNGSSPSSPLTTGASGSTTAVTGTYVPACTAASITTGPANQTVFAGQTATFSVTAAGTAPLTYAWTKNPSTSVGTNNDSFTTAPTTLQDSGSTYKVTVSNGCGSVTSGNATLTVNPVATALAVYNASGTYGGTTTLTATLTANAVGVSGKSIAFTLNGNPVGSATTDANGLATLSNVSIAGINASATPYAGYVGASFTPAAGETTYGSSNGSGSLTVNKATATINVTPYSVTYDGTAHTATATATGVNNADLSADLDLSGTTHTAAGDYTADSWSFHDPNGNYSDAGGTVHDQIARADAVIHVTGYTGTYDGKAHGATGTAVGVETPTPADLNSLLHLGSSFTDVPGGTANWTFDGNTNYKPASGSVQVVINQADAVIDVHGYTGTYDGKAHGATGTAVGVETPTPADLNSLLHLGASFTDVPGGTANWTFDGNTNYKPANGSVQIVINQADAVINVHGFTGTYDGKAHGATGTAVGVETPTPADLNSLLHLGASFTDVPGGTANWTFDGNTNYKPANGSVQIVINQADAVINVTGYTGTYDGKAHGATGTAVGVESPTPADLNSLLHLGSSFTDVPGGTANWTFDGNTNYKSTSGSVQIVINKADAVIDVHGYTGSYDGNPHGATGTAVGVETPTPADLNSLLHLGASFTNVPGGTANWTFDGNTNYKATSGSVQITINQADAKITVIGYTGTYDGNPHGATGTAVGVETPTPADLNSLLHLGSSFTNVPGGTANWTFDGNTNYNPANGSVAIVINKANANITINRYDVTYDGNSHTATGSVTGVKGETLSGLDLTGTSHTNAGDYANDPWTFTDSTGNYNSTSGTVHDQIAKANATISVTAYNVVYDGAPHTATGSATGVKGETLTGLDLSGTTHTLPGTYNNDPWTFTDTTGNYNNASGSVNDSIGFGACPSIGPADVILPPINSDGSSVFPRKKGSTIPVKFRVCNAAGQPISDPNVVFANGITGPQIAVFRVINGTVSTTNETVVATNSDVLFRFDASGQQWIFNLSTDPYTSGFTYDMQILLRANPIVFRVGMK